MKSLKEFVATRVEHKQQQEEVVVENVEQEYLSATHLPSIVVSEADKQDHGHPKDPPAILIMRRKAIRQYPNGQRVALYYVDKLNKYVTVPYSDMQWSAMPEGYTPPTKQELREDRLQTIMSLKNVSQVFAEEVLKVYKKLNEQNKEKFIELAEQDFRQLSDFVRKNK